MQSYDAGDDWDDEWDDDSESGSKPTGGLQGVPGSFHVPKSGSAGDVSSIGKGFRILVLGLRTEIKTIPCIFV